MSKTLCDNLQENAKNMISSLLKRHGFQTDTLSSHFIKETKSQNNLQITIAVHYDVCAHDPKDNMVKVHAYITSEKNSISKNSDSMHRHEVRFGHEEILQPGHEIKTIETVLEFILNEQELYSDKIAQLIYKK